MDMTTTFDDLETPLSAMAITPAPTTTVYTEPCKKCNGRGIVTIGYTYPRSVKCYSCNGAGKHEFKTSPQHRAKAQASAAARKQAKIDQIAQRGDRHGVRGGWRGLIRFGDRRAFEQGIEGVQADHVVGFEIDAVGGQAP